MDFETDEGETRRFHFTVTNHVRAGRSIRTYKPDPSEAFGRSYLGVPLNGWPADLDIRVLGQLIVGAFELAQARFPVDEALLEEVSRRRSLLKERWDADHSPVGPHDPPQPGPSSDQGA